MLRLKQFWSATGLLPLQILCSEPSRGRFCPRIRRYRSKVEYNVENTGLSLAQPEESVEKIKLLYLVSLEYSGSTLVALLLGSHKDIATVGELSGPDPRIKKEEHPCSCGSTTLECPFWRRIEERLTEKGIQYSVFGQDKRWRCSNNRYISYALTRPVKSKLIDLASDFWIGDPGQHPASSKIRRKTDDHP